MPVATRLTVVVFLVSTGVGSVQLAHASDDTSAVEAFVSIFGDDADAARQALATRSQAEGVDMEMLASQSLSEFTTAREDGATLASSPLNLELRPQTVDVEPYEAELELVTLNTAYRSPTSADDNDGGFVPIGAADYRGDFFYYPSSSWGINHGHVGIYRWRKVIVEAANSDTGVRKVSAYTRKVPANQTYILWVGDSFAKQRAAADWSKTTVGADYRPWWHSSNKYHSAPWNCSQLLWSAYHRQGIGLDSNGGDWVFPADIVNSAKTHAYRRI